ncbi:MAG TPA: hypothetical protein VKX17_18915 [Planctomycetota bacterium]|nr:hypothetical protein [Planctomycetota bacterium]
MAAVQNTEKLAKARTKNRTFEIAAILAALYADEPQVARNELAQESAFVRVAFILKLKGITNRKLAAALKTHENYISRCLSKQIGLTRKWQQIAQFLQVPQSWIAFGHGEFQTADEAKKEVPHASPELTVAISDKSKEQPFKVFLPRPFTPIQLPRPAFGYQKGTFVLTVPRPGKVWERVIFEMTDGRWDTGWMISPGWKGYHALLAADDGTSKFNSSMIKEVPLDQIKNSYVVVDRTQEPLRQPEAPVVYEADLPDDYSDEPEEERP